MTLVDKLSEFIALTGEEILRDGYNVQVYIEDLKLKAYILVGSLTALYVSLIYFVVFSAVDNGVTWESVFHLLLAGVNGLVFVAAVHTALGMIKDNDDCIERCRRSAVQMTDLMNSAKWVLSD